MTTFLGLGSNQDDPLVQLHKCLGAIEGADGLWLDRPSDISPVFQTSPVGGVEQADFLNCVLRVETALEPWELLGVIQGIEAGMGRRPEVRWGPRCIDIDVLLYGTNVIDSHDLVIPHPRMHERLFVLEPLCCLAPDLLHPRLGRTMSTLRSELLAGGCNERVVQVGAAGWWREDSTAQ